MIFRIVFPSFTLASRKSKRNKKTTRTKKRYPYISEEVKIDYQKAKITLDETLTVPRGKLSFLAVMLISGSGSQDRNKTVASHCPLIKVICPLLAINGEKRFKGTFNWSKLDILHFPPKDMNRFSYNTFCCLKNSLR